MLGVLGIDGVLGMEGIDGGFIPPPPPMPDMPDIGLIGGSMPAPDLRLLRGGRQCADWTLAVRRQATTSSGRRAVHQRLLRYAVSGVLSTSASRPGSRLPVDVRLRVRGSGPAEHFAARPIGVARVRHEVPEAPADLVSRREELGLPVRAMWLGLGPRTCRSAGRRHGRRFDLSRLRCNVARSGGRDRFRRRPRLRKDRPDHRHHRQGAKPATLAIHDFLDRIVCLLIYGVHLRSRIIHNSSTFVDCVGHRGEQISLCLNRFAVALIDDVHPFDHASVVVAEDRGR